MWSVNSGTLTDLAGLSTANIVPPAATDLPNPKGTRNPGFLPAHRPLLTTCPHPFHQPLPLPLANPRKPAPTHPNTLNSPLFTSHQTTQLFFSPAFYTGQRPFPLERNQPFHFQESIFPLHRSLEKEGLVATLSERSRGRFAGKSLTRPPKTGAKLVFFAGVFAPLSEAPESSLFPFWFCRLSLILISTISNQMSLRPQWTVLSQKKKGERHKSKKEKSSSRRPGFRATHDVREGKSRYSRIDTSKRQHWTISDSSDSPETPEQYYSESTTETGTDWTMVNTDWATESEESMGTSVQERLRRFKRENLSSLWNVIVDKTGDGSDASESRSSFTEEVFRSLTAATNLSNRAWRSPLPSRQKDVHVHPAPGKGKGKKGSEDMSKSESAASLSQQSTSRLVSSDEGMSPSHSSGSVGSNASVASASSTATGTSLSSDSSHMATPAGHSTASMGHPHASSTASIGPGTNRTSRTHSSDSTTSSLVSIWSRNFESWSEIPKHESVSRFYSEAWLRGKPVKCKITDRPNDQLLFEGTIWRRLPDRKYAVKFQDGEVLICPRNHIFPTTFSSPVLNAEKWASRLSEDTLGLFMVDYPKPQLPTISSHISARILDFLYIGDKESSEDEELLEQLNVKLVMRIHTAPLSVSDLRMYDRLGIQVHTIAIWDCAEVSIQDHWKDALPIIHKHRQAGHQVLLHCEAGRSRSGSMGLAYVMQHGDTKPLTLVQAMHKVRVCRDDVYPNPTFWKALIRFERELLGSESIPEEAVQDLHAYNWHYFGDGQGGALRKNDSQTEGKQARDLLNELSSETRGVVTYVAA
eukprot:g9447.t1